MPRSLAEMFDRVHDPRKRKGKVHDLTPMLCLAVVAMLAGRTSLQGIAQFGRDHGKTLAFALGFRRGKTPCVATYSRVFRRLDIDPFEAVLRDWILQRCPDLGEHFALDGKALRGSHDGDVPAVHLVALFAPTVQAVVGQIRVDAKTNEHKAALTLLGVVPVRGKVITGDAMFCQTEIADTLAKEGAEYLLHVKDNQPTVKARIAELLDATASFSPLGGVGPGREYGPHGGQGARADRDSHGTQLPVAQSLAPGARVHESSAGGADRTGAEGSGCGRGVGGVLRDEFGFDASDGVRLDALDSGALGDREPVAPRAGRDVGRGRVAGAEGEFGGGDGGVTECGDPPAEGREGGEHPRRHPPPPSPPRGSHRPPQQHTV